MRRSKASWANATASVFALALLAAACTPSVQTGDPSLLPSRDATRPPNTEPPDPAAASPSPSPSPSDLDEDGTLEFRVRDARDVARPGVPVRYRGPANGTAVTGRKGIVRVDVPAGTYQIDIPVGCVEQLEVFRGARARATVFEGTRSVVNLRNIDARAGIWLANPMVWDADPPWQVGDRITATVTVIDRCHQRPAAAGTDVSWMRWKAGGAIEMTGDAPTRSDRDRTVRVGFRCAEAGVASLLFIDPVTGEQEDMIRIKRTFDSVEPTCG